MSDLIRVHSLGGAAYWIRAYRIRSMQRKRKGPDYTSNLSMAPGFKIPELDEHTVIGIEGGKEPLRVRETPEEINKQIDDVDPFADIRARLERIENLLKGQRG